jgi:phage-related protein
VAAKNNNKMNISYTIKAIDRFSKTHAKLEAQLNRLNSVAEGLDTTKDIKIDADTALADKQLDNTKDKVDKIPRFKTITLMVKGFKQGLNDADNFATKLRTMEEMTQGVARGALWAMLPTIANTLGIAAGGAGALAAQLIGASAGAGAFAMVAVPTIGYLKEMDAETKRGSKSWYKLSDGTRAALTELDKLRDSWGKMQEQFREPVLDIFALNLAGARTALQMFNPTISSAVNAVRNLSEAFNKNLMSDDVKGIFTWLGETAGPYLEKFGKTIGNFIVGFMNMMVAFDPLTQDFADGFLNMSERFREWSSTLESNQAFQRFLDYTRENGPKLLEFLGNMITFLVDLGVAMAPVGEKVMEFTNKLFELGSELLKNNDWLGKAIAWFFVAKGAIGLVLPVISLLMIAFRTLWPVISTVWKWMGSLIGVVVRVFPIVARLGLTLLRLATGPMGILIAAVFYLAMVIWDNWDSIWAKTKEIFGKVKDWIVRKWEEIEAKWEIVKALYRALRDTFQEMEDAVREKMTALHKTIIDKWNAAQDFFENIDLMQIGKDIINGLIDGIKSIDVKGAVKSIAGDIKSGFTNFFDINSPSRVMKTDVGRWITLGVLDGMTSMKSKAERTAEIVANAIKRPFDNMSKDYTFTAGVATARGAYTASQNPMSTFVPQQTATSSDGSAAPAYAVINIGGHEAKGVIQYVTREQKREESRDKKFK